MRYVSVGLVAAVLALGAPTRTPAQSHATTGLREEIKVQLDEAGNKLGQLAQAIPADAYAWRPAEGVRSVSEVFVHVAGANYFFPTFLGSKVPAPFGADGEAKLTDKAEIVRELKASFDHARSVVDGVPEGDLDNTVSVFGRQMTYRHLLLAMASHAHEHLGQAIAYARVKGVAPPWSISAE